MLSTVIAVAGALLGVLLGGVTQSRSARAQRVEARTEARRDAQLAAVKDLSVALEAHRRTMWVRERKRLDDADPAVLERCGADVHASRDALSGPLALVALLAHPIAAGADAAAQASYRLRGAVSGEDLDALRAAAAEASQRFTAQAAAFFGP